MHFMFNSTYGIIQQDGQPIPSSTFAANTIIIALTAGIVISLWGCKTMMFCGDGREDVKDA